MRIRSAAALFVLATPLWGCQDIENVRSAGEARIEVQNLTSSTLEAVYTPPCAGGAEGANRLGGHTVAPGGLKDFAIIPGCYDVVGDFADGTRRVVEDVRTFPDVQSRVVFPG